MVLDLLLRRQVSYFSLSLLLNKASILFPSGAAPPLNYFGGQGEAMWVIDELLHLCPYLVAFYVVIRSLGNKLPGLHDETNSVLLWNR